jgi:hypothetical protein
MLLKAILIIITLGTSTVAMGQPYRPYDYDQPRVHEETSIVRGRFARRIVLARDVTVGASRQSSFIRIDPRTNVTRIRLELTGGRAFVDSVFVTYTGGYQETFAVGQMISRRTPRLVIDLPAAGTVSGIAINSSPMRAARGGGFRVHRAATVDVIGVRQGRWRR